MGTVNYNGKTVSDKSIKTVLTNVATELEVDVTVTGPTLCCPGTWLAE